jgi:hypothetical protein
MATAAVGLGEETESQMPSPIAISQSNLKFQHKINRTSYGSTLWTVYICSIAYSN